MSIYLNLKKNSKRYKVHRLKRHLIYVYGEDRGMQRYYKIIRGASLKYFIFRFGVIEGNRKYKLYRMRGTKEAYITKYGEDEGIKKYIEKNKKLSVSTESLKNNGYTDDEIKDIQQKHAKNSAITKENMIHNYGLEEGTRRYENYTNNTRVSVRSIDELISRKGLSLEDAKLYVKQIQRRDLPFFIKKYGTIIGKDKYQKATIKKAYANTEEYYKNIYGEGTGKEIWKEVVHKRMSIGSDSKPQIEFAMNIYNRLNQKTKSRFIGMPITKSCIIYFEKNKYNLNYCIPDVIIDKNIIEFDGDYWHTLPNILERDIQKTVLLISMGYQIIRVKYSDYIKNKNSSDFYDKITEQCNIKEINEN